MSPGDAKVSSIDLRLRGDADTRVASAVLNRARQSKRQRHRFGDSFDRQVAVQDVTLPFLLNARALECHLQVLLNLEEVGCAQVFVSTGHTGFDTLDLGS